MLTFDTTRNNQKSKEMFPTRHHSVLDSIKKTEELSRECVQKLEDVRKGKIVTDKLEPANVPPLPCACLKFETRADHAHRSRRTRGKYFFIK